MIDKLALDGCDEVFDFEVRYEGGDAELHCIDMMALGESLQGFAKIYSVISHYAMTGQYAKRAQALTTKTYARETAAKCFSITGIISAASQANMFHGFIGTFITAIMTYVMGKRSAGGKDEAMKHLKEILEQQNGHDEKMLSRMMDSIDRLSDNLSPSIRKAVAPIGESCRYIDIYADGTKQQSLNAEDKAVLMSEEEYEITDEKEYIISITEMDSINLKCKIHLLGDEDSEISSFTSMPDTLPPRINAEITDPSARIANNQYARAFSERKYIKVKAKAFMKKGEIHRFFISNSIKFVI